MIPNIKGNIFQVPTLRPEVGSDVRCHVRDDVRFHGRDDGRDGEPSILHFPFNYAGFRRSMVGMLGLLAKMVNRKNGWITQRPYFLLFPHPPMQLVL
jgi:hypothetical protein